jgi:urea carboxylase
MTETLTGVQAARYSWGGDEYIFVELAEEMSLRANFRAMAITKVLREQRPDGVLEICPANASYQVRYDPDVLEPHTLLGLLQDIEKQVGDAGDFALDTRLVEIPVLYRDPWTTETLMRFRDRHQDPSGTDIDYAARINGLAGPDEFIAAHAGSPWFTSMVGFVAGLPFMFQMVPRERQLVVPKYLRPRTDTPKQTVGHGGCFGCIYSVRGAGGYQMFGITPAPIYDPTQKLPDFADFMVFFRPGDIVTFTPVDRERYDAHLAEVDAGEFRINARPVQFSPQPFLDDPDGYNARLLAGEYDGGAQS